MNLPVAYRPMSLRDAKVGLDKIWMEGRLETIEAIGIYAPSNDRVAECPIRSDWRAIHICTDSGSVWIGEPVKP